MSIETYDPNVRPIAYPAPAHPVLRILVSFPIACFFCAMATDVAYTQTADIMWADFSAWLLAIGMIMGVLAAVAGAIHLLAHRHGRAWRPTVALVLGSLIVLILGLLNNLVHSRDAWTSVVPLGLVLSAATVVVMLLTAWFSSARLYRYGLVDNSGVRP